MQHTCSDITRLIEQDLQYVSSKPICDLCIIRAKDGVHVYRCLYDSYPAVVKYFENESDRREILNYKILTRHNIPTIRPLAMGAASLVLEDISKSEEWRLGIKEDFADIDVAKCLANWYFVFHENGSAAPELGTLYFEFDSITKENIEMIMEKLPEGNELFQFLLSNFDRLRELIFAPNFTTTYNDFYWTNFVVRKDKKAAMMFDYNLLGKGYRYSDFNNICSSLSAETGKMFVEEYRRLYLEKHGQSRSAEEQMEAQVDEVVVPLFAVICAFGHETFPGWAANSKREILDGTVLKKAKRLFKCS